MITMRESENNFLPYSSTSCFDCGTKTTSLWRRDNLGNTVCNACRLYFLHHNRKRPISAIPHVIKRRNRKKQSKPKPTSPVNIESNCWPEYQIKNPIALSRPAYNSVSQSNLTIGLQTNTISNYTHLEFRRETRRESCELPPIDRLNLGVSHIHSFLDNSLHRPAFQTEPNSLPTLPSLVNIIPFPDSLSAPVSGNRHKLLPSDLEFYHYSPPSHTGTKISSDPVQDAKSETYPTSFHSSPPFSNPSLFDHLRTSVLSLGLDHCSPISDLRLRSNTHSPPPPSPH